MGDIVKKGTKDRPRFYIRYIDSNGTRRQRAVRGARTVGEAQRVLSAAELRVAQGKVGIVVPTEAEKAQGSITVKQLAEAFLAGYTNPKIKDIESYRAEAKSRLEVRVYPHVGSRAAASLEVTDMERLRDLLLKDYSGSSVKSTLAAISKMYNWGKRAKLVSCDNPVSGCVRPEVAESVDYFDAGEVQKLLAHAEEHHPDLHPMIATAVYCGLRKGELLGLRWRNVHLPAKRLDVIHSYDGAPKSGKGRHVPINPELATILTQWKARAPENALGLVFPVNGTLATEDQDLGFAAVVKAAACHVPAKPWHACRHSFASHFMMSRGNILSLQRILGHSTLAMTMRYAHLAPDFMAEEVSRMSFIPRVAGVTPITDGGRDLDKQADAAGG